MKEYIYSTFLIGICFYIISAILGIIKIKKIRNIFFLFGVIMLFVSLVIRIYYNSPLMSLFQESYIVSLCTGIAAIAIYLIPRYKDYSIPVGIIAVLLSLYSYFFPGDIYVSFVNTNSIFAHIFSILSSSARAVYLCSGAAAVYYIVNLKKNKMERANLAIINNLIITGFCLHSAGMFSGGIWSYIGWGAPVQWQSHIFLGMAGIWFFYSWYLHLKLSGNSAKNRLVYSALAGGILVLIFSFLPETGKFNGLRVF